MRPRKGKPRRPSEEKNHGARRSWQKRRLIEEQMQAAKTNEPKGAMFKHAAHKA